MVGRGFVDWSNEPWIKQYKRRTVEWSMASFDARGLYNEITTLVDKAGYLVLGRAGVPGLAHVLNMPADRCQLALDELVSHEWAVVVGDRVLLPDHQAAQEAITSNRLRQAQFRERAKANERESQVDCDDSSRDVTEHNATSRDVTRSNEKKEKKEEKEEKSALRADAPSSPRELDVVSSEAADVAAYLLEAILEHKPDFSQSAAAWPRQANKLLKRKGVTVERLKAAIDYAHRDLTAWEKWRTNIRSIEKLGEQLDTLEGQMRSAGHKARPRQVTLEEAGIRDGDELLRQRRAAANGGNP